LGGNAGLSDPKYWPATHGSDLYAYLPKNSLPAAHARAWSREERVESIVYFIASRPIG